jgi:hypothetical protein
MGSAAGGPFRHCEQRAVRALQLAVGRPAIGGPGRFHAGVAWHAQLAKSPLGLYRARVGQGPVRRGGGVRRRAVLEQPILVPELLELADDIVYYAPEFDLFLPGDTGSSSKAVGPPR